MYFDTRDHGFGAHVLLDGYWETWLTQFVARTVKAGMRVADVGANYGYYSLLMADLVGDTGDLVAIEPNPQAAAKLKSSLELNGFAGRTQVVEAAAGEKSGTAQLYIPKHEPKNAALTQKKTFDAEKGLLQEVKMVSLDEIFSGYDRVDFLKIDAEGAEEQIIAGFAGTIERCSPMIVLEFNPHRCSDPAEFIDHLERFYPSVRLISTSGALLEATRESLLSTADPEDRLLFLSRDRE
jgi:FkbM family methyltransferase